jgi:hypothetical protein
MSYRSIGHSDSFMMSIEKCKEKGLLGGGYNNIYSHESKFSKFGFGNFQPVLGTMPHWEIAWVQ